MLIRLLYEKWGNLNLWNNIIEKRECCEKNLNKEIMRIYQAKKAIIPLLKKSKKIKKSC